MNAISKGAAVLALVALPVQSVAAERQCLSRAELRTAIAYIMPALVKGVVAKCVPALPAEAYLVRDGKALADRYAGQSQGDPEQVRALVAKFMPIDGLTGADSQSTAAFVESLVTVGVQGAIKTETCPDISTALGLLDPLPAANMNGLIEFVLVQGDEGNARKLSASRDTDSAGRDRNRSLRDAPFLCESLALAGKTGR